MRRYRRAADYLAAAMTCLKDNMVLREPLQVEDLKPRLLGHWGTCPGITSVYTGLNRLIRDTGTADLLVTGLGHGAPSSLLDADVTVLDDAIWRTRPSSPHNTFRLLSLPLISVAAWAQRISRCASGHRCSAMSYRAASSGDDQ